jgi:alanine racemase
MDSIMVDVTNIDGVKVNDKVYIWDNEIITLDEIAKKCNTINYEIISGISSRVPREFV